MSRDKWVRRFSVDETARHKDGFTIYKITSVLFPIDSPEALSVVSVWKRYSDVQRLHASMKPLHAGLHLKGNFPVLPKYSFFKRFQQEVIDERAKVIKTLLEFIAEHKLLFTSTDFVNFLQSGHTPPITNPGGVINTIRSSLQLPVEECPPLEYHTDEEDTSPQHHARHPHQSTDELDFISRIPEYRAADVETRLDREASPSPPSIASLDSIGSDLYSELDKISIQSATPLVKRNVLPDLITFDAPSTSRFEDIHTTTTDSDNISLSSNVHSVHTDRSYTRSNSVSTKSVVSLSVSNIECKTKTEDSYVFEAGYMLNLAARYEDMAEYGRAFECYKAGIEKMLIGVQSDTDAQRRALIKEKTNKYLSYAETLYKNHLCDTDQSLLQDKVPPPRALHCPIPTSMLRRPYEELSLYRVVAVLSHSIMLVLHRAEQTCYAMKVIQKIPNNLTEFDEYFLQNTNETRQPILPTVIPYMVPLHSYIETNNLIFLILSYAPGEKLFDYIKNYAKSNPNTPAREVNLENVFTEPKIKHIDLENENIDRTEENIEVKTLESTNDSEISIIETVDEIDSSNNNKTDNYESMDVSEIVLNSQKLLENVDKVLSEVSIVDDGKEVKLENVKINVIDEVKVQNVERVKTPEYIRPPLSPHCSLPPTTIRRWGAQLLTALESLHNAGVICRDLNPSNILLGEAGQVILTYFVSYPDLEVTLTKLHTTELNLYVAPELYTHTYVMCEDVVEKSGGAVEMACDWWSYGAVMYYLLCGVPLCTFHRSVFTSHTMLHMPGGLPVEVQSLLTQLLTYEPSERLGAGKDGVEEIKRHPYFNQIDWAQIYDTWSVPD